MEWLFGLAIIPMLLCGVMCVGGIVLAALGVRRGAARRPCGHDQTSASTAHQEHAGAAQR